MKKKAKRLFGRRSRPDPTLNPVLIMGAHELSGPFPVPGRDHVVYFRRLAAAELRRVVMPFDGTDGRRFWASILAATAVDAGGNLLFTDGDIPRLDAMPAYVIEPMARAAALFNGLPV